MASNYNNNHQIKYHNFQIQAKKNVIRGLYSIYMESRKRGRRRRKI